MKSLKKERMKKQKRKPGPKPAYPGKPFLSFNVRWVYFSEIAAQKLDCRFDEGEGVNFTRIDGRIYAYRSTEKGATVKDGRGIRCSGADLRKIQAPQGHYMLGDAEYDEERELDLFEMIPMKHANT